MKRFLWLLLGGLPAATAMTATTVVTASNDAQATSVSNALPGEAAVYARFSDLADIATEDRLAALEKSSYEQLEELASKLENGASAKEIEGIVLAFIKGQTPADVDTTLAAIMLDQYLTYVRPDFEAGLIGVSDVFDDLIARDVVLTTAAYGSTTGYKRIRR